MEQLVDKKECQDEVRCIKGRKKRAIQNKNHDNQCMPLRYYLGTDSLYLHTTSSQESHGSHIIMIQGGLNLMLCRSKVQVITEEVT